MVMTTEADAAGGAGLDIRHRGRAAATPNAAAPTERCCCDCGTPVPRNQDRCAICERRVNADPAERGRTAVNWLIMAALMGAIFAAGIWFGP